MKAYLPLALLALLIAVHSAHGQGTVLLLDQYSSLNESVAFGGSIIQQAPTPFGQSFTPTFSSIDFIRLNLNDALPGNGFGATIYLTLHSGSISGPLLNSTTPVFLPDSSSTITTFYFPESVALTPNDTYFFQVLTQPGSGWWSIVSGGYLYAGGSIFSGGFPLTTDLWFQSHQQVC